MAPKKNPPNKLSDRVRTVTAPPAPAAVPKTAKPLKPRQARASKFKHATIVMSDGLKLDVILRNLSESGARIDFYGDGADIVGPVLLLEPSLGLKKRARVVWKDRNSAGLSFEK